MTRKQLAQISTRIAAIKAELATIGEMRPGSLTRQYKEPKDRRGAYYQLSYTREMKSRTVYVSRAHVGEVRRQIANYKRFRALVDQWVKLSIQQCQLRSRSMRGS
jgi:Family of unknown function (DUF6788)